MNRKGISLIALIITIIVMVIIIGITVAGVGNAIGNSRKTSFASDLNSLQDTINVYYIQNGEFPVLEENGEKLEYIYSTGKLQQKNNDSNEVKINNVAKFESELKVNFDMSDGENIVSDTVFYKIDLNKIGVEKTKRGTGEKGNDDIFVMSYPTQTLYYLKGYKIGDDIYFSTAKLSGIQNISQRDEMATDTTEIIQTAAGMSVKRLKKAWTNTLDITIDAYLESAESIYIQIPQSGTVIEKKLTTTSGQNVITLNSLSNNLQLTKEEIENFNNLDSKQKYLIVVKKQGTAPVANIKVNLANYETEVPKFPLKADGTTYDFNITSNDGYNLVSFKPIDNISGIKEVRYVFLKEFDENGIPTAVHKNDLGQEITTFTNEFVISNGKMAYISNDNNVEMKLPKDVESVYITMFDKAGNSVSMQKNVQTDIYAGINLKNITDKLILNYAIKSNSQILSAKTSISTDNTNYTNETTLTLTSSANGIYVSNASFNNDNLKEVYIKLVVSNSSGQTETRIKKINVSDKAFEIVNSVVPGIIYNENKTYTDKNGDSAILPAGFKVSSKSNEQIIDNGLVIIDKLDNEFVWVPCTIDGADGTIKYAKRFDEYPKLSDMTSVSDDINALPMKDSTTRVNETEQIIKYGGFYVGRYEAGVPANQSVINGSSTSTSNVDGIPVIKKGAIVWTCISYNKAMPNAKKLHENSTSVRSGIITGTQFDTICAWIQSEKDNQNNPVHDIMNSISWGNFSNTTGRAQYDTDGTTKISGTKQASGRSEYWKAKNIYDFAGNAFELTGEFFSAYSVDRGGLYNNGATVGPAAHRGYMSTSFAYVGSSFRVVLYVM